MRNLQETFTHTLCLWMKRVGLLVVLLAGWAPPGYALWIGQAQVNPYLEIQGKYESNIFRANTGEESDWVTIISPGIHFHTPTAQNSLFRLIANYRANIYYFTNNGDSSIDPDEELNTIDHRLDGEIHLDMASGVQAKTGYILNVTSNAPDFPGNTREEYLEHAFFGQLGYAFVDQFEVQLRYDGTMRRYDDNEIDDITEHSVETTGFYKLFPTISVLAGGGFTLIGREEAPTTSDSNEYSGFAGVRYEATEDMTGIVKAGIVSKDFDSSALDDVTEFFARGELNLNLSDETLVSVFLDRSIEETSITDDTMKYGAYSVRTGLGANVELRLASLPNLAFLGDLAYWQESYPEDEIDDRSDTSIEFGSGVEYTFLKYLLAGFHYRFSTKDSNLDENDYTDHSAILRFRALL